MKKSLLFSLIYFLNCVAFAVGLDVSDAVKPVAPVEPKPPTLENCETSPDVVDSNCASRNQAKQTAFQNEQQAYTQKLQQYNFEMGIYNSKVQANAQADQAAAAQKAQNEELARIKASSASGSLNAAKQKNEQSKEANELASMITEGISAAAMAAFAGTPCGPQTPGYCVIPFLIKSILHKLLSDKHSDQASQNAASAFAACSAGNQISSASANCGPKPPAFIPPENPFTGIGKVIDANGNCIATDKTLCDKLKAALPPGTNLKDVGKTAASFANGKGFFKTNPDGSITTKDGKTFRASDFKDEKSLISAGLSPSDAKNLFSSLNNGFGGGGLAAAKADLKDGKDGKKGYDFSGLAIGGGGGGTITLKGSSAGPNGAGVGAKKLNGTERDREPAAAGLTKDFNGEPVGAAGDDLFIMMNRRYSLKTAQDSFIGD